MNTKLLLRTVGTGTRTVRAAFFATLLLFCACVHAQGECEVYAGTLNGFKPTDCLSDGAVVIGGIANGDAVLPAGYVRRFILAQNGTIEQVSNGPIFVVNEEAVYTIHTLIFDPTTLELADINIGSTSTAMVNSWLLQGGGSLCGSLDLVGVSILVQNPSAGSIFASANEVCLQNGSANVTAQSASGTVVPEGYSLVYVLTSGSGYVIESISASPSFTVSTEGSYHIHTLVYDPAMLDLNVVDFGSTPASEVNSLFYQGGGTFCGALDLSGASVSVIECLEPCLADAGSISGFKPTDCLGDGGTAIGGIPNGNSVVPIGYEVAYVLTTEPGAVIQQTRPFPIFDVLDVGVYTVHTLVYDPATLDLSTIVLGVTSAAEVNGLLVQGGGSICAALDLVGTTIQIDNPETGTLDAMDAAVCLTNGTATLNAIPSGGLYAPNGYAVTYVLTQGADLVIVDVSGEPSFEVSAIGDYTIHTLVYDPATLNIGTIVVGTTTGYDVNGILYQGGGGICAALDVMGAAFSVTDCNTPCIADAGSLSAVTSTVCLEDGSGEVTATVTTSPVIPAGYQLTYLLSSGANLAIQQFGTAPEFFVAFASTYTIHALVYDPTTFDLSTIQLGVTTGAEVNAMLIQGGGSICAGLLVNGPQFVVFDCMEECLAVAPALNPTASPCLQSGSLVVVDAVVNNSTAVVPAGYSVVYVLSSAPDFVILDTHTTPSFPVYAAGTYRIHSLVYDPNTLDLSTIQFGVTTVDGFNAMLVQGGGNICASFMVNGVTLPVEGCINTCLAVAPELDGTGTPCLVPGNSVVVDAVVDNTNAVVPPGYNVIYFLTSGTNAVISATHNTPSFTVYALGSYTIHSLVYEPNTLDLNVIEFGVTTAAGLNAWLVQGGGKSCGALDLLGATMQVVACSTECTAQAGTLSNVSNIGCLVDGVFNTVATPNGDAVVENGAVQAYVLTYGPDVVIMQIGSTPNFSVTTPGVYSMHSFVYDPNTLDLSIIELGVTTGADVVQYVILNGADVCASLDMTGVQFVVGNCELPCLAKVHLTPQTNSGCLDNGMITLIATPNANANIPNGYVLVYILANNDGQVIEEINNTGSFVVNSAGVYSMHGLIYDPTTLDLSVVTPGMSILNALHLLLTQSDEPFCAGIDIPGVSYTVQECFALATVGTVWPNPVVDNVNVKVSAAVVGSVSDNVQLTIVNAAGNDVKTVNVNSDLRAPVTINVSTLVAGSYFIHVQGPKGTETLRFIKLDKE